MGMIFSKVANVPLTKMVDQLDIGDIVDLNDDLFMMTGRTGSSSTSKQLVELGTGIVHSIPITTIVRLVEGTFSWDYKHGN